MGETVLVVGGAGYIGSQCARLLADLGHTPVVFDNLSTGWRDFVRYGPFEHGDIRDAAAVDRVLSTHRPKLVLHFAAKSLVGESMKVPLDYFSNNVTGSLSLLEGCVRHEVENFVLSSTAAVYGVPEAQPIPLDAKLQPINPYGASKMMVERAIEDVCRASGTMGATCFRYFNAAGAHPDGDLGERHEPETHLIPNVLKAAVEGRSMKLFGDDYDTPDGTCVRDYIHVLDLVKAHVAVLEHPPTPGETRRFNLGTGEGLSVKQVIEACQRVTGRDIGVDIEGRRPGDPPALVAGDTDRAREALNWTPEHSDVDSIVTHAWAWHRRDLEA